MYEVEEIEEQELMAIYKKFVMNGLKVELCKI